jgi:hypothetical protein
MIIRPQKMVVAMGAVLALTVPAGIAQANTDPGVERHGACSGAARWELDAEREGTKLEVEFDVDRAAPGRTWQVHLRQDGALIADTARTTDGHGGFELHRLTANTAGPDTFSARAVSPSGQVCRGAVTLAG